MIVGRTVHVVPSSDGNWQVVDLNRHVFTFPSRALALQHAKAVAESNQPSQVVLFDEYGQVNPIARYQLPQYPRDAGSGGGPIEAAVKALVLGGLIAAGAMVAEGLIDAVDRDLKKENRTPQRRKRSPAH